MKSKVLVIASAGGHLTQAMCATAACNNIVLVSNKIAISDPRIKKTYKIYDTQHNLFIHLINFFYAIILLLRERPQAVFSTGGPIVLPFALICRILPIRFVYLDTLSRVIELSNSGKLIKRFKLYDYFFCQWQSVAKENGVEFIGKSFDILGVNKVGELKELEDKPKKPIILVTIGTNDYPFERALALVSAMPLYRDDRVQWVMQVGDNIVSDSPKNGEILSLVNRKQMEVYVKNSSLVISHCGIGSINLMLSYRKRVIFVPRVERYGEFSDDHQLQIAGQLKNPLFSVVNPGEAFPDISYEELNSQKIIKEPVDITDYSVSKKIKKALFG